MPFGSNTVTYRVVANKDGTISLGKHGEPRLKAVAVPAAEPPSWWSGYLLAEWKRKNGVDQKRRDSRTGWQRDRDEWDARERLYGHRVDRIMSTGMPRHEVWGGKTIAERTEVKA